MIFSINQFLGTGGHLHLGIMDFQRQTHRGGYYSHLKGGILTASNKKHLCIRATPKVSLYRFLLIGMKIIVKNILQRFLLLGLQLLPSFIPDFSMVKDRERGLFSIVCTRYTKILEDGKILKTVLIK